MNGRMAGHDAELAFDARDDDHVDLVGADQPLGGHQLEVKVGH